MKWSTYEDKLLIANLDNKKFLLENLNNRSISSIYKRTKVLGLTKKHNTVDKHYFYEYSDENCYWAGFLAADGCISNDGSVTVALSSLDIDHIKKFINDTSYSGCVRSNEVKIKEKIYNASRVKIHSDRRWGFDLNKNFKLTPRKTFTLDPPDITIRSHIISYIRGYFDGDGSIGYYGTSASLFVLGTYNILEWTKIFIDRELGLDKYQITKYKNQYRYRIHGKNCIKFMDLLYSVHGPLLQRKYNKYLDICKIYNRNAA